MTLKTLTQNISNAVVTLATALLGWIAFSVEQSNVKLAVLSEKVSRLEAHYSDRHHFETSAFVPVSPLNPWDPQRPEATRVLGLPPTEPRRK